MKNYEKTQRKLIWPNIIFFSVTTLVAVIGAPLYLMKNGISTSELVLFLFFMMATGSSITVGYHRLFSHNTYKAHPVIRFILLFFGAAAFQGSCLDWSSQHRDHHQFVDTDKDPYDIKKGFFHAHMGWMLLWEHKINYSNAKDLQKDKLLMHQDKHYLLWSLTSSFIVPLIIGALTGHILGAFVLASCTRLVIVHHATFFINSVCHLFGKSTYDIHASAKDHWFVAFLTYGEGYHNFHHRFPNDYRNGVRWYQWDPSKWIIALLTRFNLTSNLRRVSYFKILDAQIGAENQRIDEALQKIGNSQKLAKVIEILRVKHETLKANLVDWENLVKEYKMLLSEKVTVHSLELRKATITKINQAKSGFKKKREQWAKLLDLKPIEIYSYLQIN